VVAVALAGVKTGRAATKRIDACIVIVTGNAQVGFADATVTGEDKDLLLRVRVEYRRT
jgi:hypothetical protein